MKIAYKYRTAIYPGSVFYFFLSKAGLLNIGY